MFDANLLKDRRDSQDAVRSAVFDNLEVPGAMEPWLTCKRIKEEAK
jgi:hypothetical protein